MRVIGTVGLPGSGKGEFSAVAEELDIPVVTMGDVIRAACRERGLDPAEHHGQVARDLREERGPTAIAEASLPHVEAALEDADTVLVDGIRSDVEVDVFEERFGEDFTLVGIEAPRELRAERVDARGRDLVGDDGGGGDGDGERDGDAGGGETLAARDERELGFGLGAALERADVTIDNAGSLESFREAAREVLG